MSLTYFKPIEVKNKLTGTLEAGYYCPDIPSYIYLYAVELPNCFLI